MADDTRKPTTRDLRTLRAEAMRQALEGDVDAALRASALAELVQQDVEPEPTATDQP